MLLPRRVGGGLADRCTSGFLVSIWWDCRPWKQEVARRAAVIAENLVHGDKSVPLQGPMPVKVTWSPWDASWGAFHHGISSGVCAQTTGPAKGFLCGGIQVRFVTSPDRAPLPSFLSFLVMVMLTARALSLCLSFSPLAPST